MIDWNIKAVDKRLFGVQKLFGFSYPLYLFSNMHRTSLCLITYGTCDDLQKLRITSAYSPFLCVVLISLCFYSFIFKKQEPHRHLLIVGLIQPGRSCQDACFLLIYCISLEMVAWYKYKSIKKGTQQSVLCSRTDQCGDLGRVLTGQALSLNKASYDQTSVLNPPSHPDSVQNFKKFNLFY